jgi:hypothetical protein
VITLHSDPDQKTLDRVNQELLESLKLIKLFMSQDDQASLEDEQETYEGLCHLALALENKIEHQKQIMTTAYAR